MPARGGRDTSPPRNPIQALLLSENNSTDSTTRYPRHPPTQTRYLCTPRLCVKDVTTILCLWHRMGERGRRAQTSCIVRRDSSSRYPGYSLRHSLASAQPTSPLLETQIRAALLTCTIILMPAMLHETRDAADPKNVLTTHRVSPMCP